MEVELELRLSLPNHSPMKIQGLNADGDWRRCRASMHVKVKMEGVGIGRKVDLRQYDSYQAFTNTLINMFAKYSKVERSREDYRFLYQDNKGDWMTVGDVQWELFVESVRRVEILRAKWAKDGDFSTICYG